MGAEPIFVSTKFLAQQLKKKINGTKRLKNMKAKPLAKGKFAMKGNMTLAEKVATAPESAENPAEAAKELKGMMTKQEHSKAWSKHNIHMRGKSKKEQKEFNSLPEGGKGPGGCHVPA